MNISYISYKIYNKIKYKLYKIFLLKHEKDKVMELMSQLKLLQQKDGSHREKYTELQTEMEKQRKMFEEQILTLQKDKIQLSDNLQQVLIFTFLYFV